MPRLSYREPFPPSHSAFTLVELLIVIAIIAILAVVVILVLNPIELLRQSRDSNRISDLATLNTALAAYNTDQSSGNMGSATKVYVSIADSTSTCANLGLPGLPTGYSYNCATSANLRKTDGTGWVPVNLTSISFGTPLATLPIDPVNTTTTGNYYTYIPGGSWELTSNFEAARYKGVNNQAGTDGGDSFNSYEVGTNLTLTPIQVEEFERDPNLIGYWPFDESAGLTAYDASGNGNNATYVNGPVQLSVGCKKSNCISFDGDNDYLSMGDPSGMKITGSVSASAWVYTYDSRGGDYILQRMNAYGFGGFTFGISSGAIFMRIADDSSYYSVVSTLAIPLNVWTHVAFTYSSPSSLKFYINGALTDTFNPNKTMTVENDNGPYIGTTSWGLSSPGVNYKYYGKMDDLRFYNRQLSDSEIQAIYNATK